MKRLQIDFAPNSARRAVARTAALAWLLAMVGVVGCVSGTLRVSSLMQQHRALDLDAQNVQAKLAERALRKPLLRKFDIPEAQAGAVNSAILQLNLPWRDVLDAVQSATPNSVALLALEPDAKKRLLKGVAEVKASDGMIAYIEQLKQQPFFDAVVLTRHETNEQDPNKPLRFQFEAYWSQGEK